eukprot:Selendium_serpulae@DN6534_c0_g1_i1.p2
MAIEVGSHNDLTTFKTFVDLLHGQAHATSIRNFWDLRETEYDLRDAGVQDPVRIRIQLSRNFTVGVHMNTNISKTERIKLELKLSLLYANLKRYKSLDGQIHSLSVRFGGKTQNA